MAWLWAVAVVVAGSGILPTLEFSNPSRRFGTQPSALDQLGLGDAFFHNAFQKRIFRGHALQLLNISLEQSVHSMSQQDMGKIKFHTNAGHTLSNPPSLQDLQKRLSSNNESIVFRTQNEGALQFSPGTLALKRELQHLLNQPVTANLYVSGAYSTALPPHTDTTDTIIVHEQGRKMWILCVPKPSLELMIANLTDADLAEIQETKIGKSKGCSSYKLDDMIKTMSCTNVTLVAGDVMYIPKGVVHQARELDGNTSVHLTIALGRTNVSFNELINHALRLSKVETTPIFWHQKEMLWDVIFQKAIKQFETTDQGISLRRTVPMWMIHNVDSDEATLVFNYYKSALAAIQTNVFLVLKDIYVLDTESKLKGLVTTIFNILKRFETFANASSALLISMDSQPVLPETLVDCPSGSHQLQSINSSAMDVRFTDVGSPSRRLLADENCMNSCLQQYDQCYSVKCPLLCGCNGPCTSSCDADCDGDCNDGCNKCDNCDYGGCNSCDKSCDENCQTSCDESCDGCSGCTVPCEPSCAQPCNTARITCQNGCVRCGLIPTPSSGLLSVTYSLADRYGSTATFSCATGYVLSSTATRICQVNEQWSGINPQCNNLPCSQLTHPLATYSPTTNLVYRQPQYDAVFTTVTWTCPPGYILNGPTTSTCNADLTWTPSPQCDNVDECINNPCIGGTCTDTIGSFFCTCPLGYALFGTVLCIGKPCEPLTPPVGASISFRQKIWLNLTTEIMTEPSVEITQMTSSSVEIIQTTNSTSSYTCSYKCSAELICPERMFPHPSIDSSLNASNLMMCDPDLSNQLVSWNFATKNQKLECVFPTCPSSPPNGRIYGGNVAWPLENNIVKSPLRHPDVIRIDCDLGYIAVGPSTWNCAYEAQTSWVCKDSANSLVNCTPPQCVGRLCAPVPAVLNGYAFPNVTQRYPANITYACYPGYINMATDGMIGVCDASSGEWKNGVQDCVGLYCGIPPAGANMSEPSYTALRFPSTATYTCLPGFIPSSSPTTFCNTSGFWPEPPVCVERRIIHMTSINDTVQSSNIVITGLFGNGVVKNVTFGPKSQMDRFQCLNPSMNRTTVTCVIPPLVGTGFWVRIHMLEFGRIAFIDRFGLNYIAPVITDILGTSRFGENLVFSPGLLRYGARSGGDLITIQGRHFGTDTRRLQVLYGLRYVCVNVQQLSCTSTMNCTLVCTTSRGSGSFLQFRVAAGPSPDTLSTSAASSGTFSYPDGPSVTSVSGCNPDPLQPAGTINCPTNGGVLINLTGTVFIDPLSNASTLSVTVGSNACPVRSFTSTYLSCYLQSGTGISQAVAVSVGDLSGDAQFLLSYAAATIDNVTGCNNLQDCPRDGGVLIVIDGKDFGPSRARVLIGENACENVTHVSYNQITCILAAGKGLNKIVSVLQYDGQYTTSNLTLGYIVCPAGQYDPGNQATSSCVDCSPGTYSDLSNREFCEQCPSGKFQAESGKSYCDVAEPGQYVNGTGAIAVSMCPPGTYTSQPNSLICSPCEPGRYTSLNQSQTCILCDPGTIQPIAGKTACEDCLSGTYQSAQGMIACVSCPSGTVSNMSAESCTSCLAGTYQNLNATDCLLCAIGYYSDHHLSVGCDACVPGKYNTEIGCSSCQPCNAGDFQQDYNATGCLPCTPGTFQQSTAASSCDNCAPGHYSNSSSASVCSICTPGYFAAAQGQSSCASCPVGSFAWFSRSDGCQLCGPGTFSDSIAASECRTCPPGRSNKDYNSTNCTLCAPGSASTAFGLTTCALCDLGTFSSDWGSSICTECLAGYYSFEIASSTCGACIAGKFAAYNRSIACEFCPAGTISLLNASTRCQICTAGSFSSFPGSTNCTGCSPGRFSGLAGVTTCLSCYPGYISNMTSSTACVSCDRGKYAPGQRYTACIECDVGYFASNLASVGCQRCIPGSFANITGALLCSQCPAGTISASGVATCEACRKGTYSPVIGGSTCLLCAKGKFSNVSMHTECVDCLAGTYQDNMGLTFCEPCQPGFVNGANTSSSCQSCQLGKYMPDYGGTRCQDCLAGYYSSYFGAENCSICDEGTFSISNASSSCEVCDAGKYNSELASSNCLSCVEGSFSAQTGSSNCSECLAGTFAGGQGNSFCAPCDPGYYASMNGASICDSCEIGKYTSVASSQFCIACLPGTFSSQQTAPQGCFDCTPGNYQNMSSGTACFPCLEGWFGTSDRMSTCLQCPPGKFRDIPGAEECLACEEGRYVDFAGATSCIACSTGSYAPSTGISTCILCSRGTYADKTSSFSCQSCTAGRYAADVGATGCTDCPSGKFQNARGAFVCSDCSPGKYSAQGASDCPKCQRQTVNPWIGMGKCFRCADQAKSSEAGDVCICPMGTFAPVRTKTDSVFLCTPCTLGFDCTEEGVKFATLGVKSGWWRADVNQLVASPCIIQKHCVGGHNSTCGIFRRGVLCAFCEEGYSASGTGKTGTCSACPADRAGAYVVIVFGTLGALIALVLVYGLVLFSDRELVASLRKEQVNHFHSPDASLRKNDVAKIVTEDVNESTNSSISESILETESNREKIKRLIGFGATGLETRIKPNVVYKLKIVTGFLQILTNLTLSVTMPWPTAFRSFMLIFAFLNFDFLPWGTVGCVTSLEYIDKILIICSIPLCTLAFGGFILLILQRTYKQPDRHFVLKISKYRILKLYAWTLFLLYPFLCAVILKYFVCRTIGDDVYLEADFAIQCYSDQWNRGVPIAVIATLLYPVGIPVVFGLYLYWNRFRLDDYDMRLKFGFLVDAYHRSSWWFELIWSINKMFCCSLVAFFPTDIQIQAAMVWLGLFLICLLLARPYIRKGEDRLAQLCITEIILLLMYCLSLVQYNGQIDAATDVLMSILMIFIVIGALLIALTLALQNIWKMVNRWRQKKKGILKFESTIIDERKEKNRSLVTRRQTLDLDTGSKSFEKDLVQFNFSPTW